MSEGTQGDTVTRPIPIVSSEGFLSMGNLTVYKDGRVERAPENPPPVPANEHPPPAGNGVATRDVTINPEHATWVRLYLPQSDPKQKLPLLLYFHGGGFVIGSTASTYNHSFLEKLAAEARVVIVSVDYRLAPEHPLPAAYEDCFEALLWLEAQAGREGSADADPWLAEHADFRRLFIGGDSAGANIVHHVAIKAVLGLGFGAGERLPAPPLERLSLKGLVFIHPFFTCGVSETISIEKEIWKLSGAGQDHWFADPLREDGMGVGGGGDDGCRESEAWPRFPVSLVLVAEKDMLCKRGVVYHKAVVEHGRLAELFVSQDEDHVFHLFCPGSKNVTPFLQKLRDFLNA